jgi:hypothetical protein
MNVKRLISWCSILIIGLALASCVGKTTDYAKAEHWLALPAKADKPVDIFYLYPTVWSKINKNDPNICEVNYPAMVKNAKIAFAIQATVFETVGNIYAPYYRQADASILSLPMEEQVKLEAGIPAGDVIAAFDYYIKHYNNGRPYILAGHSQGSDMLTFLLSDYMKKNPKVYSKMIVAYVIGYSITKDYLVKNPHLKFAEGPNDTGVIVSYNTEAPDFKGSNPVLLPGAIAINPITWTRDGTLATAKQNLGSLLPNKKGKFVLVRNYADARVDKDRGVVVCSTADGDKFSGHNTTFAKGVFHSCDYPFYYYDIRENAANRTKYFLNK